MNNRDEYVDVTGDSVDFSYPSNGDPFVVDVSTNPFDAADTPTTISSTNNEGYDTVLSISSVPSSLSSSRDMKTLSSPYEGSLSSRPSTQLESSALVTSENSNNLGNVRVFMKSQSQANVGNFDNVYPSNSTSTNQLSIPIPEPAFGVDYYFSVNLVNSKLPPHQ
jgi:hypothetical protein